MNQQCIESAPPRHAGEAARPHLIKVSRVCPHESAAQRHLDPFSRFCTIHQCVHTETTCEFCIASGRLYALRAGDAA